MRTPVATLAAYLEGLEDGVTTLDGDTGDVMRAQLSRLSRLAEASILAALINALLLLVAIGAIATEAIRRGVAISSCFGAASTTARASAPVLIPHPSTRRPGLPP